MPSPKHPCAHPECGSLVARKEVKFCRSHAIRTAAHAAKISAALTGRSVSPETRRKLSEARRGTAPTERICRHCGGQFRVQKPSERKRHCSNACAGTARSGQHSVGWAEDMPTSKCAICAQPMRSSARKVRRVVCSYSCLGIYRMRRQRNRGTNIERLMRWALSYAGWRVIEQHAIPGAGVPDFYLPDAKAVVFCDGDYWHSRPGRAERDARQTERLQAMGYTVYRFLGSAIIADLNSCLRAIRRGSFSST